MQQLQTINTLIDLLLALHATQGLARKKIHALPYIIASASGGIAKFHGQHCLLQFGRRKNRYLPASVPSGNQFRLLQLISKTAHQIVFYTDKTTQHTKSRDD